MSVVVNNLRLTVKRGISQGKIVQEVRVKDTNAHVDCPVSGFFVTTMVHRHFLIFFFICPSFTDIHALRLFF